MVSGRVPLYVVDYAKKNKITISDLILSGFNKFRENDEKHALSRYNYHEDRLIHWKQIVLQLQQECNTKHQLCNTVREVFIENKRNSGFTPRQNKVWLEPKVNDLTKKGIPITVDELYMFCVKEVK